MGPKHSRDEILRAALVVARSEGLSRLSFGRVAEHMGISDRTVVYYFPTKDDLATAVVTEIALELQATLETAFDEPVADHRDLLRTAWPILARPSADPVFALFFEANGLAVTGLAPYRDLVPNLVRVFIAWAAEHIDGPPDHRRTEAETAIAVLDGLLLLRQLAGPAAANRAARNLGANRR